MSPDSDISAVVMAALGSEDVSITGMLRAVAEQFGAFGCGLWELSPFEANHKGEKTASTKLVTVAAWWQDGRQFAMDDVPIEGSPTGQAIVTNTSRRVPDIQTEEGGPKRREQFWRDNDIHAMCVAPVRFIDDCKGAINVYRAGLDSPFSDEEEARLSRIASLIPCLYRGVREKIELKLVKDIGELLIYEREDKAGKALSQAKVKKRLENVCKLVAKAFFCVEASIFLKDSKEPALYKLAATSDHRCVKQKAYREDQGTPSLTEHVLNSGSDIRVPDLTKIYDYTDWLAGYGYKPTAPLAHYTDHARAVLGLSKTDLLRPISFLAMPIFGEREGHLSTDLCGVIRCYGAKEGPYYFEDRDARTLKVVAQLVGRWWGAWRTRTELEEQKWNWTKVGEQLDAMNELALRVLNEQRDCRDDLLREGLRVAEAALPGAELNGYRLMTKRRTC